MKTILWSLLGLFLVGDALFVLPYHLSSDAVTTNYYINYKKDSVLIHTNFPDNGIRLKLNMPPGYEKLYEELPNSAGQDTTQHELFVNISVFHNLDFTAVSFPFYKVTSFNGVIPFYSLIKAVNAPELDSTALVGNIVVNGKVVIKGICSPLYARTLVEKELVHIIRTEVGRMETDINRKPVADTSQRTIPIKPAIQKAVKKNRK